MQSVHPIHFNDISVPALGMRSVQLHKAVTLNQFHSPLVSCEVTTFIGHNLNKEN